MEQILVPTSPPPPRPHPQYGKNSLPGDPNKLKQNHVFSVVSNCMKIMKQKLKCIPR